jgi:glycosyltransferase involved in cell wall biosynthesis
MRIAYFIPGWPPDLASNGIAATLGRLANALEKLGHEVHFITPVLFDGVQDSRILLLEPDQHSGLIDRVRWKFDFERKKFESVALRISEQLQVLILTKKIEIFQMEETEGWVGLVASRTMIPVVTRLHGPWFTQATIRSQKNLRKSHDGRIRREGVAIKSSFAVTAPSASVLQATKEFYGKISSITEVIPNPVPMPSNVDIWSEKESDKFTLLFVGRFDEVKGGDVVLRAFAELLKKYPFLKLLFIGPDVGARTKAGKQVRFEEFVQTELPSEASSRIEFLGQIPHSLIEQWRKKSAITIVASRYETFGNAVAEAMAIGSPIVATRVGGIPELLQDGRNALLVEPGDHLKLANACSLMLENPQMGADLGRQARADCAKNFSPSEIATRHIEFYSKVIKSYNSKSQKD